MPLLWCNHCRTPSAAAGIPGYHRTAKHASFIMHSLSVLNVVIVLQVLQLFVVVMRPTMHSRNIDPGGGGGGGVVLGFLPGLEGFLW